MTSKYYNDNDDDDEEEEFISKAIEQAEFDITSNSDINTNDYSHRYDHLFNTTSTTTTTISDNNDINSDPFKDIEQESYDIPIAIPNDMIIPKTHKQYQTMIRTVRQVKEGNDPQLEFKLQVGLGFNNNNDNTFEFLKPTSIYNPFYIFLKSISLEDVVNILINQKSNSIIDTNDDEKHIEESSTVHENNALSLLGDIYNDDDDNDNDNDNSNINDNNTDELDDKNNEEHKNNENKEDTEGIEDNEPDKDKNGINDNDDSNDRSRKRKSRDRSRSRSRSKSHNRSRSRSESRNRSKHQRPRRKFTCAPPSSKPPIDLIETSKRLKQKIKDILLTL